MKTIFLFIPNYVYTTDIIRTGLLGLLSKSFRVVVYLPTLEYVDLFPKFLNVEYRIWSIKSKRFWGYFKTLRLGLIREFDNLVSIQVHYQVGFNDYKRKILRQVTKLLPFSLKTRLFTKLETIFLPMRSDFETDVKKYLPSLVVFCTPGFTDFESEAIILSKKLHLPTVATNFSWDNLTTNAKHIRHTDFLVTWNKYIKDEAILYHGYSEDKVFISGPMRFDRYFTKKPTGTKKDFLSSKNLDPNLPLIVLTTTSHGVYPYHSELIESLLKICAGWKVKKYNLLVRIHPKDDIERYSQFYNRNNVCIENPGQRRKVTGDSRHKIEMEERDLENLQNTLSYADVVINHCSTITLEALACGAEVVNIHYPDGVAKMHYEYVHYKPVIDSGAVRLVDNESELEVVIKEHFSNPTYLKNQRELLVKSFFYKTDGKAYERCADIISNIVSFL